MSETSIQPECLSPSDTAGADEKDISAALRGERAAFDRLVLRHQQAVINAAYYFLGNHQDALEVAQEAFLSAYKGLSGFLGRSAFRTWLLRITANTARSLQTKRKAKKRSGPKISLSGLNREGESTDLDIMDETHSPEALLLRKEVKECLEAAIAALEPEAKKLIILRDLSGESYESISKALGMPLGTVKSKVHRARLQLREAMREFV